MKEATKRLTSSRQSKFGFTVQWLFFRCFQFSLIGDNRPRVFYKTSFDLEYFRSCISLRKRALFNLFNGMLLAQSVALLKTFSNDGFGSELCIENCREISFSTRLTARGVFLLKRVESRKNICHWQFSRCVFYENTIFSGKHVGSEFGNVTF